MLGFSRAADLGKYLGMPLHHKRVTKSTYQFLLDKANNRLSGWKEKSLSLVGRMTLTQSVLAALPIYAMQTTLIPRQICTELDKKCRNFVWGSSSDKRKIHLVNWNTVCQPKVLGGAGLRQSSLVNTANMMKIGWNLMHRKDDLWVQVVRSKYACGMTLCLK